MRDSLGNESQVTSIDVTSKWKPKVVREALDGLHVRRWDDLPRGQHESHWETLGVFAISTAIMGSLEIMIHDACNTTGRSDVQGHRRRQAPVFRIATSGTLTPNPIIGIIC